MFAIMFACSTVHVSVGDQGRAGDKKVIDADSEVDLKVGNQ